MNTINININSAKIESFSVALGDGSPSVRATVGLYAGGKKISDFTISTESWRDIQFTLPPDMVPPIIRIAQQLEVILVRECVTALNQIGVPNADS